MSIKMDERKKSGYRPGDDPVFDRFHEVIEVLMNDPGGKTAAEMIADLCFQEYPTTIADYIFISRVHRNTLTNFVKVKS